MLIWLLLKRVFILALLLDVCHRTPELNKCITSGITSKLLEFITRIHYSNVETAHALKCLETCLKIFPGSCVPFKTSIEKFLLSFVDYTNSLVIVRLVGKCFHLFQQVISHILTVLRYIFNGLAFRLEAVVHRE